jgi:Fe2+ transport system protein FeoA
MTLAQLLDSQKARIVQVSTHGVHTERLLELGFTPNTCVQCLRASSAPDGVCVCLIRGSVFTLSNILANHVLVEQLA